jgi:TRAP-type C4-dicarboxylate transport system permease small subunit
VAANDNNPKFVELLVKACMWVAVGALIIMTVIIGWQVFGRFVLNDTPKWTEQLAGVLMVYLTMFGAAACVSDDGLIALDIFRNKMNAGTQAILVLFCELVIFAFSAVLLIYGLKMTTLVTEWYIPTLGMPRTVMYAAFPVAGALMLLFSAVRIKRFLSHL